MTIREKLRRTERIIFICATPAFLLVVIGGATEHHGIALLGFLGFFAAVISQFFAFRCPKCRGNLFLLQGRLGEPWNLMRKAGFCPFCAIDLDSELDDLP